MLWSPGQHYKQTGGKRGTIHEFTLSDRYGFKNCKKLINWARAKKIKCETMRLFFKSTHLAHLYTPSQWYTPRKFWYTLGCTIHPVDKHWSRISIFTFLETWLHCLAAEGTREKNSKLSSWYASLVRRNGGKVAIDTCIQLLQRTCAKSIQCRPTLWF